MLEANVQCKGPISMLAECLMALPSGLKPTHFSVDEMPFSKARKLESNEGYEDLSREYPSGFFLIGKGVQYDVECDNDSASCFATLSVDADEAKLFLSLLSQTNPSFGYVCDPAERIRRNRLIKHFGDRRIEAWVGRDLKKYVPGLYWLTVMSDSFMATHNVSPVALTNASWEHASPTRHSHIFQFYEKPEDWAASTRVEAVIRSSPGIFNIDAIRSDFDQVQTRSDISTVLHCWR